MVYAQLRAVVPSLPRDPAGNADESAVGEALVAHGIHLLCVLAATGPAPPASAAPAAPSPTTGSLSDNTDDRVPPVAKLMRYLHQWNVGGTIVSRLAPRCR